MKKLQKLQKLKQVGKGGFSRCYELDAETVLLESFDPIKEVMAEGKFPKSKLFPSVHHYPNNYGVGGSFYTMYYYRGMPEKRATMRWLKENLKPFHYEAYLSLFELRKSVESSIKGKRGINRQEVWNNAFATLENKKLGCLLIDAHNACCEISDNVMFDCKPRNVIPHEGNLILLDCFYSSKLFYKMKFSEKPEWALDWK